MKKVLLACMLVAILSALPVAVLANNGTQIIDESGGKTLEEGYGVYTSPTFYNLYAGWTGTVNLTIINGRDQDRLFFIRLEKPRGLEQDYQALPEEYYSWVAISSNVVSASAGEVVGVPVTITIPDDIVYANRHDQIAFQVADITDQFVKIELQSYWYLTTDPYIPIVTDMTNHGNPNMILIMAVATATVIGSCGIYLLRRRQHAKA